MAKVTVKVLGAQPKDIEASTVGEAKEVLGLTNYTGSVFGNTQEDDYELSDGDFISFAASVKGGNK